MKVNFFLTGGYAKILRRCVDYLPDVEVSGICPNWQSLQEAKNEPRIKSLDYLYDGLNEIFDQIDVEDFCEKWASINLYEIMQVDKSFYKKKPGDYQLRYICSVGVRIEQIFKKDKPNYIFFPIIETIEAMLAYRMAMHFGIRPIVYCHARFTNRSFFSDSHYESLPKYADLLEVSGDIKEWANEFIENYRKNPGPFQYRAKFLGGEVYSGYAENVGPFKRLLRNVWLKNGLERHNQLISYWISFQVYFQKIFIPLRNLMFYLIESKILKPKTAPAGDYEFFPLHFSPESSINVPAPYFIDQTRVVDKILLERSGNRVLVVKEHPAMFGFRGRDFYKMLLRRPLVQFVPRNTPSFQIIKNAKKVYSVTGTACLEAFFYGVEWVQFGENFLSDWVRRRTYKNLSSSPAEFVGQVCAVSGDFVLYTPGMSPDDDLILFSKKNVEQLCKHLMFHISMDKNHNPSNKSKLD